MDLARWCSAGPWVELRYSSRTGASHRERLPVARGISSSQVEVKPSPLSLIVLCAYLARVVPIGSTKSSSPE